MTTASESGVPFSSQSRLEGTPGENPAFLAVSGLLIVALAAGAYALQAAGEQKLALSVVFGAIFGVVLQRARFCFLCNFRDWYDARDPRGLYAILIALAAGLAGYTLVFGAWLPDASGGRLPPDAFIGPVGIALVIAGLVFGAGMAISGSCISAHLYRLGEGSPTAPFALIGTVAGFILGFVTWNPLYLGLVSAAPTVWLPRWLGYSGALLLGFAVLLAIALLLRRTAKPMPANTTQDIWRQIFIDRWPAWAGGLAIGALGTAAYLRVAPLGVTAEISGRSRDLGNAFGLLPQRLEGLDTLRGCVSIFRDAIVSPNGAFVIALVVASFAAALIAGKFKPALPNRGQVARGLFGGVLLGWGAMTGLGCTIGTLLSGIMAGALSGWVFGAALFAGIAVTLSLGRRAGLAI
jgi:uncharacterized protein